MQSLRRHVVTAAVGVLGVGALAVAVMADTPAGPPAGQTPFSRAWAPIPAEVAGLFPGGARPISLGSASIDHLDPAACATCHPAIAAEWRESMHAAAWTDPVFQAAYAHEPLAFCRNCHAPLNDGRATPTGRAASDGVSCAACHVRDGRILGAGRHRETAPHPVHVSPIVSDSAFCAPCHEFGFESSGGDGARAVETMELQQATFSEWVAWAGSQPAAPTCQTCHMPAVEGAGGSHRSHRFDGFRDPGLMANAVTVLAEATREAGAVTLAFDVRPNAVGHAVPSGDLNRRLELEVWRVQGARRTRLGTLTFARSYRERQVAGLGQVRTVAKDTRVGVDPETTRVLQVQAEAGETLVWTLSHLRMPRDIAGKLGIETGVNVRTMARGTVTVP